MTTKELKLMLKNIDDDAILLIRDPESPQNFLSVSAREINVVSAKGVYMLPQWAKASGYIPDGVPKKAVLFE